MEKSRTAEELLHCDSICSKHDVRCELKGYQQASYRFHGRKDADGKMCIWPKTLSTWGSPHEGGPRESRV